MQKRKTDKNTRGDSKLILSAIAIGTTLKVYYYPLQCNT